MTTTTLYVHIKAPFAALRWLQAGNYRASSRVIPPSTAWGLLLNIAGIESRASTPPDEVAPLTTQVREDAPPLTLAIGVPTLTQEVSALYQQLHHYPVGGNISKSYKEGAKGAKYHISPTWREVLVEFEALIALQADEQIATRLRKGLAGDFNADRYGVPFLGDNNFLLDEVRLLDAPPFPVHWYERMQPDDDVRRGSCRLTVTIDRADGSKTTVPLFAPTEEALSTVPEYAWVTVPGD